MSKRTQGAPGSQPIAHHHLPTSLFVRQSATYPLQTTNILIVETRRLIADALAGIIEGFGTATIAIAETEEEALKKLDPKLDFVIMDVSLSWALKAVTAMRRLNDATRMVALSEPGLPLETVVEALQTGFFGVISRSVSSERFAAALASILKGYIVVECDVLLVDVGVESSRSRHPWKVSLTVRELEILQLLVAGRRPQDIARTLWISPNTLRTHLQRIFHKMQVHSNGRLFPRPSVSASFHSMGLNPLSRVIKEKTRIP